MISIFSPVAFQLDLLDPSLFDYVWESTAAARYFYGTAAEELASVVLGFDRIAPCGGYDVCFDGRRDSTFYEVKSVRRGSKVPLYTWRLEKDELAGVPLLYVFVVHKIKGARSVSEVWDGFEQGVEVWLLDRAHVKALATGLQRHTIDLKSTASGDRNGYQRKGYRHGMSGSHAKQSSPNSPTPFRRPRAPTVGQSPFRCTAVYLTQSANPCYNPPMLETTNGNANSLDDLQHTNPLEAARLIKILNLAARAGTQGETEAALGKALELAVKHNLDLSALTPEDIEKRTQLRTSDPIICRQIQVAKGRYRRPPCFKYVNRILNRHFNVYTVYSAEAHEASVVDFVGKRADVNRAEYVMFFLIGAFNHLWRAHALQHTLPTSHRDTYWWGLWMGFNDKLDKALTDAKDKAWDTASREDREAYEKRFSLTTKDQREVLEAEANEKLGTIVTVADRARPIVSWGTFEAGRTDGKSLTIADGIGNSGGNVGNSGGNVETA